ncbi:gamma-glutamyltransferase family protein [Desulfovibrio ferrophilus]|uniref:Gamma-glutamyltransferase n=1 Tax=Desulfovibrio ferrophilus TaxID=241368 RepID=A0A2Z6AUW0_9BACT|nr:gamma-glutamyltransferase family protein [Desulfovibrio ferrophilus]BBD07032.1 gamma-glutamyltransferase [Desulfovibrio ferrophilus]
MPAEPHCSAPPEFRFDSRRSPVYAKGGMAAASQPLAVEAGLSMLRRGGNAADAAVAMAAVLAVTEPASTGPGGDAFALFFEAETGRVHGLNGSGRSPQGLTFDLLKQRGLKELPARSALSVTVPGAISAWCSLLERHGTLPLGAVLEPAIRHATDGFPVGPVSADLWASGAQEVLGSAPGGQALLRGGKAPRAGQLVNNSDLGRLLATLAEAGTTADAFELFYRGEIASRLAQTVKDAGGVLDETDLHAHEAVFPKPVSTVYNGMRIFECAPNGQGVTALMALNILDALDASATTEPMSAQRLHLQIEALRLAFADAHRFVADSETMDIGIEALLDPAYAAQRAGLVRPDRAMTDIPHGVPMASSDTVYFCVVDSQGNAVSMVNSVYRSFGTGITPEGLGFSLQNRADNFSMDPNHPNALGPGKRTYHTIIPGLAVREADGSLYGPFGVMGGFMQPQGHVQLLCALLDDGLAPQAALDRLRFCLPAGSPYDAVAMEEGLSETLRGELRAMGHKAAYVRGWDRALFGRGQVILRDPATGWLCGGSDARGDGLAFGF